MNKSSTLYKKIDGFLEHSWLFNLTQLVLDPGKSTHIRKFIDKLDFRSVIDLGCGTGNWVWVGRDRYLGIDTSPSFIAACKKRYADDPTKEFIQADASTLTLPEKYDLTILISVLHHISDEETNQLVAWVAKNSCYFFILDLYPMKWNPISRWLYSMDRGNFIREPEAQKSLIMNHSGMRLIKEDSYYCINGLYRHTLFLFESTAID